MAIRILMIDDHPSQIEGYKVILTYNHSNEEIVPTACYNCESAFRIIMAKQSQEKFDMVFLDQNLPAYHDGKISSGEDLAMMIKRLWPETPIVFLTSHSESFLLYNLVKKVNPAGLLVKSDFDAEDLLDAFEVMLSGETYHSQTVKESMKELLSRETYLDNWNRQIITYLAKGVKTKNLPDFLPLSLSAIEKRKSQIKDYFCIGRGHDEDIVFAARKMGYV